MNIILSVNVLHSLFLYEIALTFCCLHSRLYVQPDHSFIILNELWIIILLIEPFQDLSRSQNILYMLKNLQVRRTFKLHIASSVLQINLEALLICPLFGLLKRKSVK